MDSVFFAPTHALTQHKSEINGDKKGFVENLLLE